MLAVEIEYRLVIKGEPVVCTRDELVALYDELATILQLHPQPTTRTYERAYVAPDDPRPTDGQWNDEDDATLWRMVNAERDYPTIAMLLGHSVTDCQDRYAFLARGGNQ